MAKAPRICESAGHGYGSRKPGKVDPGAVSKYGVEAAKARSLALCVAKNDAAMGNKTLFRDHGPYFLADDKAIAFKATRFREWHFDAAGKTAHGCTVLVGPNASAFEKLWAERLAEAISTTLGIPNRGVDVRADLAVLKQYKTMASVLVEVGFITSKGDMMRYDDKRHELELAVLNVDRRMSGMKPVKTLPRMLDSKKDIIKKNLKVA